MSGTALFALASAVSFGTAWTFSPLFRYLSLRMGLFDIPNERSSHALPVPRSGGKAILLGIAAGALISARLLTLQEFAVLSGMVVIALLGGLDDLFRIRESLKLLVQVLVAGSIGLVGGVVLEDPWVRSTLAILATCFWIVGATNAFNFMDGINGIASLEAGIWGTTLAVLFLREQQPAPAILSIIIAAAAIGFLPWNFPSGSIFMGDVGSTTLGFGLAGLVVIASGVGIPIIAAMLPFGPFLFDTSVTLIRRIYARERFLTAHRKHFYQRLTNLGWTHVRVTLLWSSLAFLSSIAALLYGLVPSWVRSILVLLVLAMHVVVAVGITRGEQQRRT